MTNKRLAARVALAVFICIPLLGCDYFSIVSGTELCSVWTNHKQTNDQMREMGVGWANGFFPAFYKGYTRTGAKARAMNFPQDNARLLDAMDTYCAANPKATITDAAREVMTDAMGIPGK